MASMRASIGRGFWPLVLAAAVIVAVFIIVRSLIFGFGMFRPIPYWDQWEFIKAIPHIYDRSYSLRDLFSQHNEHRIVTARLIFIIDLLLFEGTSIFSVATLYVSLALITLILSFVISKRYNIRFCVFLVMFSLILSPSQWENLSSGFQVQFPFVDLFGIASLACLLRALDGERRRLVFIGAASVLDALAVFSMASGVLLAVPALFIGVMIRPRSKLLFAYLGIHLILCVIFFIGYTRSADITPTYNPIILLQYAIVYIGSCLRGYSHAPFILGLTSFLLFIYALAQTAKRGLLDGSRVDRVQVFALALLLLLVCGAFLTGFGRASLGIEGAISSRYTLQSLLAQMSLFIVVWREADGARVSADLVRGLRAGLLLILLTISAVSHGSKLSFEEWKDRVSTYDTAGFSFANGMFSTDMLSLVYPWPALIKEPIRFLADHRLSLFSARFGNAFRPPWSAFASLDRRSLAGCTAQFGATRVGPTWFQLDGWVFNDAKPAADGWILVFNPADHDRFVGFGRQSIERGDVDDALKITVGRTGFQIGLNSPAFADKAEVPPFTILLVPLKARDPMCQASVNLPTGG